jgi:hypothetical protein
MNTFTFSIAFQQESGEFDVVESFAAENCGEANAYAERNYPDQSWYVLDADGANINA